MIYPSCMQNDRELIKSCCQRPRGKKQCRVTPGKVGAQGGAARGGLDPSIEAGTKELRGQRGKKHMRGETYARTPHMRGQQPQQRTQPHIHF